MCLGTTTELTIPRPDQARMAAAAVVRCGCQQIVEPEAGSITV